MKTKIAILLCMLATLCSGQTPQKSDLSQYVPSAFTPSASGGSFTIGSASISGFSSNNFGTHEIQSQPGIIWTGCASNCTLDHMTVNIITPASAQIIVGLYSPGSTSCPAGESFCGNTLICKSSAVTVVSGSNTIPSTSFSPSCGNFSAYQYVFMAVTASNTSMIINSAQNSYAPGTSWYLNSGTGSSFTLPSSMPTQTQPSGWYTDAIAATFDCSGSCGSQPIPWTIFTYAGNTSGATVSSTNILTGAYCYDGGITASLSSSTTYTNAATHAFSNPVNCNGTTYAGGTLSVQRVASSTNYWSFANQNPGSTTADVVFWLYNVSNTLASGDHFDIGELGGGNILTWAAEGQGTGNCPTATGAYLTVERSGGTTIDDGCYQFSTGTWYLMALYNVSGGTHQAAVFSTTGTQLPSQNHLCADNKTICIPSDVSGNPGTIRFLCEGSCASTGGTWYHGPIYYDPTGQSWTAILAGNISQIFFPDSPTVIGPTLSKMVDEGLIPHAEIKDGHWWSYALDRALD